MRGKYDEGAMQVIDLKCGIQQIDVKNIGLEKVVITKMNKMKQ